MKWIVALLLFGCWIVILGLAGESDRESALEAGYMSALAHVEASERGGRP